MPDLRYRQAYLAAALLALTLPAVGGGAFATDKVSTSTDPGFNPATGQINPGFDKKVPSASETAKIPTPAQAYAALMAPVSTQPALGAAAAPPANAPSTTGTAAITTTTTAAVATPGPIGAIGATMPAKFSSRNDTLDRVPIMALPLPLTEQQRHDILQAALADKTPAATDADKLAPSSMLSYSQYLNDMHPLPASVRDIGPVKSLAYVKTKDKVLLVEPSTRVVFDEIGS
jgi:hypothetical protein